MPAAGSTRLTSDRTAGISVGGIAIGAHEEGQESERQALLRGRRHLARLRQRQHLPIVDEHLRRRLGVQPRLPHVFDDADDLLRRELHAAVEVHELPHRILVVEQPPHHGAVDDDHRRRGRIVARLEPAARHQPHAHRLQVVVADRADVRVVGVAAHLVRRAPRRHERAEVIDDPEQRPGVGVAGALHTGQAAQFGEQTLDQRRLARRRVVLRHDEIEHQQARRIPAGVDAREPGEGVDQQAGADEQHRRHRHLRDDEHVAHARVGATGAALSAGAAVVHHLRVIESATS